MCPQIIVSLFLSQNFLLQPLSIFSHCELCINVILESKYMFCFGKYDRFYSFYTGAVSLSDEVRVVAVDGD